MYLWKKRETVKTYILTLLALIIMASGVQSQFTVSGTVTDPGMSAVSLVEIFLYDGGGNQIGIPPTFTDAFGFYTLSGLPSGTYMFGFDPPTATKLLPKLIDPVIVTSNMTLDVTLAQGVFLEGFVTDSLGVGIFNIDMNVYDQATGDQLDTPGDNTDVTGFYRIVIPSGIFRILWRPVGGEALLPVELNDVAINADTVINITMLSGFTISGTITDAFLSPVVDVDLDFIDNATGISIAVSGDKTDGSGQYAVTLPAGTYDVRAEPLALYKLLPGLILSVVVSSDVQVDFTLQAGLSLSGFVRDIFSVGVFNADIDVKNSSDGTKLLTPFDNTDASGFYEVIIPPGTYNLVYQPPVATILAPIELLDITITADTIVNVVVPNGLLLSGLVKNISGVGVASVDIDAVDESSGLKIPLVGDKTASDGTFTTVLAPGTYQIDIEPPKVTRYVAKRLTGISLGVDTSIVVTVFSGVMISGIVTDSIGSVVPDVDVNVIVSSSGDTVFTPSDNTDLTGYYEVVVPTGTYDLFYQPDILSGYADTVLLSGVIIGVDTTINVTLSNSGPVNQPPVLDPIGSKVATVGVPLLFAITASDPDGPIPQLLSGSLPSGAVLVDNNDGTADFSWTPDILQIGNHGLLFYAYDGSASDSETIQISVNDGTGCCIGIRGDMDYGGGTPGIDISDLTYLVGYMFKGGPAPPCPEEGDIDGSGGPTPIDVVDLTFLVAYMFKGGTVPPACP